MNITAKAQATREKTDKLNSSKQSTLASKDTIMETERQQRKSLYKELIFRVFKEFLKLNNKKNKPIKN